MRIRELNSKLHAIDTVIYRIKCAGGALWVAETKYALQVKITECKNAMQK